MTDERRLVSRDILAQAIAALGKQDGRYADATHRADLIWGSLAALPQPATEPALDVATEAIFGALRDAAEQAHGFMHYGAFTDCEAAICVRRFALTRARLAAQPSAEVERLRAALLRVFDMTEAQPDIRAVAHAALAESDR